MNKGNTKIGVPGDTSVPPTHEVEVLYRRRVLVCGMTLGRTFVKLVVVCVVFITLISYIVHF